MYLVGVLELIGFPRAQNCIAESYGGGMYVLANRLIKVGLIIINIPFQC